VTDRATTRPANPFASLEGLEAIVSRIDDGITVQDASGRLVFANDAAARLTEFDTADEMLEANPDTLIAAFDIADEHGQPMSPAELPGRRILAGEDGEPPPMIVRSRVPSRGDIRYSRVVARAIRDQEGRVTHVVNTFHDITDLKRNEEALAVVVESASLLATSLDYEDTLRHVSQLAVPAIADWCVVDVGEPGALPERVAVWHRDPAKRALAEDLQRNYPNAAPRPEMRDLLERGEPILMEITDQMLEQAAAIPGRGPEYLDKIRSLSPQQILIMPLVSGDRVIGSISFLSAESGRRFGPDALAYARLLARPAALAVENAKLFYSLEEAVRVRDTFLQMAAHELLTPITVVRGYSQTLARMAQRQADTVDDAGTIRVDAQRLVDSTRRLNAGSERLTRLVHDLLDLARIQRGALELAPQPTDIGAVIRDVVDAARLQQDEGRYPTTIDISVEVPSVPLVGDWDPLRLEQVFYNVIDNAVKYSPGGGTVHVTVSPAPDGVHAEVRDEGLGIAPEMLEAVFQPFVRGAQHDGFPGFGMGLAICREIVERHGGTITVASQGEGTGTSVVIDLPFARPGVPIE
jgi:PAS domain S-box-containing protein